MIDKYHVSLVTKYVRRLTETSKIFQTKQKFKKFQDFKDFEIFVFKKFNIQKNSREFLKSQRDENKVWIHLSALFQPSLKLQKDLWSPQSTFYIIYWVYPYEPNPSSELTEVPLNLKITEILSPFNDKNISEL